VVRDGYVLAKVNDVVREGVSGLASNLGGRLVVKGLCTVKPKTLNTTIEMVKRLCLKPCQTK
jgi:hypothetical protein